AAHLRRSVGGDARGRVLAPRRAAAVPPRGRAGAAPGVERTVVRLPAGGGAVRVPDPGGAALRPAGAGPTAVALLGRGGSPGVAARGSVARTAGAGAARRRRVRARGPEPAGGLRPDRGAGPGRGRGPPDH